jgi:hypothetical protein
MTIREGHKCLYLAVIHVSPLSLESIHRSSYRSSYTK